MLQKFAQNMALQKNKAYCKKNKQKQKLFFKNI